MPLASLCIRDFRNLAEVGFSPETQGLNIIHGENGSGKTSLLEAIHYLGLGRSFRSASFTRLIRYTAEKFSIVAQLVADAERHLPIGIERDVKGGARLRIAEKEAAGITELASLLPIRIINSHSHHLFEAGPSFRRKYLDWGLFYASEAFLLCWRQFERALKQRNALLREQRAFLSQTRGEFDVWTNELIKYAVEFDQLRRAYVQALAPLIIDLAEQLLGLTNLAINYEPGWAEESDYASVLNHHYGEDRRIGYTQFGPHRADIDIMHEGVSVKHFLSRGQQKMLVCAMIVAQGMLLMQSTNKRIIYLVDDLPSELDLHSTQKLISLLSLQRTQIFITAIERDAIWAFIDDLSDVPRKVFHVEQGCVVEQ